MKITNLIPFVLILILLTSCEQDKSEIHEKSKTGFKIGNNSYLASQTNLYITDHGKIIETYGDGFQLFIVLSDKSGTSFEITDSLLSNSEGAARCILKISNEFYFSTDGMINLGVDNKSGNMEISFENTVLNNGKLYIDSVINKPYIDFTSFTACDIFGTSMNSGDESDWKIRNDFQMIERLLFNVNSELLYRDLELYAYPNPLSYVISVQININQNEKIDFFMVNENFEIERKIVQLQSGPYYFLLGYPEYDGYYYRLYYKIYSDNETFYGSGDLKVDTDFWQ